MKNQLEFLPSAFKSKISGHPQSSKKKLFSGCFFFVLAESAEQGRMMAIDRCVTLNTAYWGGAGHKGQNLRKKGRVLVISGSPRG